MRNYSSPADLAKRRGRWVLDHRDIGKEHLTMVPPKIAVQTSSIATGFHIVRRGNYL